MNVISNLLYLNMYKSLINYNLSLPMIIIYIFKKMYSYYFADNDNYMFRENVRPCGFAINTICKIE